MREQSSVAKPPNFAQQCLDALGIPCKQIVDLRIDFSPLGAMVHVTRLVTKGDPGAAELLQVFEQWDVKQGELPAPVPLSGEAASLTDQVVRTGRLPAG